MADAIDKIAKELVKAIPSNKKTSPYDTQAEVLRIDGDTAWVHIPGGVDETPVQLTTNAKKGDIVQVRVSGGRAWLYGNATAPPTDDTTAIKADINALRAKDVADRAIASATQAASAAASAQTSANNAANAAASAQTSANNAQISANNANQQAQYATNYANNALLQLGTVESVVDTLTWISEHSVFVPTTDTTVQANKLYYVPANNILPMTSGTTELNGITYVVDAVSGTVTANGTATSLSLFGVGIPDATAGDKIWFSGVSGGGATTYGLRYSNGPSSVSIYDGIGTATVISSGNIYLNIYVSSGVTVNNVVFTPRVATENEGFEYQIIENPTGNPASQGWFELSTDDAVKTYVQTHLALTNEGLYVLNDSSAYKMLLANDGTYIQAPNGTTVNQSTADGNVIRATNGDVIAHLGYGEGTSTSGTADNPYYSLGTRTANSKIGNWSTSEGLNNTIAGYASHGEGADNVEYGRYNHIEGHNNRLRELYGYNLGGYAKCSHVEGENCEASGTYDGNATGVHVQNIGTIAKGDAQTAIGRYNSPDNGTDGTSAGRWGTYAFYIGNGTADNARSNALTVDWSGNVNIASGAKYQINGTNLSASDIGAVPTSRTVNNKALSSNISLTASDISAVPTSRTVNSKALSSNITLTASDVSAISTSDKYTRSSAGDIQWTNQTDGDAKVMAKSGVAFWNGAYNGTSSNLRYSANGEILGKTIVKDYVTTAPTTSGIWTYRKWSSGKIECWGEKSWTNVACTTSAGGGYRSADVTQALPSSLFTTIDSCQATMKGSSGSGYTMILRTLCDNTTVTQMFWNTSSATKTTLTVDYYIIGT